MIFSKASRVTIATLAALLSACALNVRPGVSSLLVKKGKPSVSYDVADPGKGGASKAVAPVRPETAFRAHIDSGLTVEATDKALHAALASLRQADTVENRLRVAAEYRRLRILDKAFDLVTDVLKVDHRSAEALEQRAQIWREWGFAPLGLTDAYRAVFIAPRSASARNTLGTLLQSLGNMESARRAYEEATKLDPQAAYGWSNMCYLSLVTGKPDRALTECHIALRLGPGDAAIRNNIALSYAVAGRPQEARAELLTNGSPADAAYNIGMLYLALGSYQLAEESFRTATDIRPNFSAAQTRRRQAAALRAAVRTNSYDHSNRH